VAQANGGSGASGTRWWLHWSSMELGSPSPPKSGTHRVFVLRGQSGAGSSPGSFLSGRDGPRTAGDSRMSPDLPRGME
jgi:hypothetical protein